MKLTPAWRNRLKVLTSIFLVLTVFAIIYTLAQWILSDPGNFEPLNALSFAIFPLVSALSAWLSRPNNVQPPASSKIALAETPALGPLRQQITTLFSLDELRVLCLDLGVRYDDLSGDTINSKTASLLAYAERRGQLNQLMAALQQERPQAHWPVPNTLQRQYSLRRNVRATWIDGVLKQSITDEIALELKLTLQPHALTRKVMYVPRQEDTLIEKDVPTLFSEYGSLLILGEPGSGKTMTLLQLAESLLDDAEQDPSLAMPVILNLSSWAAEQKPLTDWLVEELWQQYQVTREAGRALIQNNQLIYLLDGLDEVAEVARADCVTAINTFKAAHPSGMAMCSRVEEYEALSEKVNLGMGIHIQPLTKVQVEEYFKRPELELDAVYQLWQIDDALQKLAQTPLFLSTITLAYRGLTQVDLNQLKTEAARRDHLYEHYIAEMFRHRPLSKETNYDETEALNWLINLSHGMQQHMQTVFFIERLTPTWLPNNISHKRYLWITKFSGILLFSIIGFLLFNPIIGKLSGSILGLLLGLASVISVTREKKVTLLESMIQYHLDQSNVDKKVKSNPREILQEAQRGFLRSLLFLLVLSLIGTFYVQPISFIDGMFRLHFFNLVMVFFIPFVLGISLPTGVMLLQFYFLRWLLARAKILPFAFHDSALTAYLDAMSNRLILRRVGVGWIFIHRSLLDYFASLHPDAKREINDV